MNRLKEMDLNISEKLDKKNIEDIIALTPLQEAILFHYLKNPASDDYFEQLCLEISGKIQVDLFEKAWNFVIENNEMLRAVFRWQKVDRPVQIILKEHNLKIKYYDLSHLDPEEKSREIERIKINDRAERFDLRNVPFRVSLCKRGAGQYQLIISNHHILYDGWSNGIILGDFFRAYNDLPGKKTIKKTFKYKFKEFINVLQHQQDLNGQEMYWKKHLKDFEVRPKLSTRRKKSDGADQVRNYQVKFDEGLKAQLEQVVKERGRTLTSLLYVGWALLLQKYNNTDDVILGTVVSGRSLQLEGIEDIVGLFINTIPFRVKTFVDENVEDLCGRLYNALREREAYESTPLRNIKKYCQIDDGEDLFDSIVAIENYPLDRKLIQEKSPISVRSYSVFEKVTYDLTVTITIFDGIEVTYIYHSQLFDHHRILRLSHHFSRLLGDMANHPSKKIPDLEILSVQEKKQLLRYFNNTGVDYPKDKRIQELFAVQVERRSDNIALVSKNHHLTYRALDKSSNGLALLLDREGVKSGDIVGIMANRSMELVVGILGILKVGGAYLPVDPGFPGNRLRYMIRDSAVKVMLSQCQFVKKAPEGLRVRQLDLKPEDSHCLGEKKRSVKMNRAGDLAYVMYTSGSSGQPRGVLVEHRNVTRLVIQAKYVQLTHKTRILQTGAPVFDATTLEIWGSLLNGGTLFLVDKEIILDANNLGKTLLKNHINTLWLSSPLFNQLMQQKSTIFSNLDYLLVGGDVLIPKLINQVRAINKKLKVINGYGPTENTTFSACYLIDRDFEDHIPIGKPINNSTAYILDRNGRQQPIGVFGELCVGGDGIARGYLNRPALTREKFIENSFKGDSQLYRTGDRARWQPEGVIEFGGRLDHQVKIRGYRIETGEIETQLLNHPMVNEAAVVVMKDQEGNKYLCAYVVNNDESALSVPALREYLSGELPGYMMPSYFVKLKELPLNQNGKIAYQSLPDPGESDLESGIEYAAPRDTLERKLVEVWETVLGRKSIGINDNFFMIGGDSILAIQAASRMNKAGYKVGVKDLFQYPTIAELVPFLEKPRRSTDQSIIKGIVLLTPIQKEFFSLSFKAPHYFNMYMSLDLKEPVEKEVLQAVFSKLQEHHDALRMTFKAVNGKIIQYNHGMGYPFSLEEYDFRNRGDAEKAVQYKSSEIQTTIDLEKGPIMKLGLFHLDDGDQLLIAIHHLVMDGVSWRILSEDTAALYQQQQKGEPFSLPLKTGSFKAWAEKLYEYANSEPFLKEKVYWANLESTIVPVIKRDFEEENNDVKDTVILSFCLTPGETHLLLTKVNHAFNTGINDILLSGLALGLKKTFGHHRFSVALEGHGREEIFQDIDVNRTLGWFTIVYPVILNIADEYDLSRQLKEIKETLHRVPNKGIGYGILKYLTADKLKEGMNFKLEPKISFNYLGQFSSDLQQVSLARADAAIANSMGLNEQRKYDFDISGIIENGRLIMSIAYNKKHYKNETIKFLWRNYELELKRIISYCSTRKEREFTPCDFTYKGLSIEKVEQLSQQYSLEDIYTLSPMQEGMIFHAFEGKGASTYFEQISYSIQNELDIPMVKKSLKELFKRHGILRTVFIIEGEGVDKPLQLVLKDRLIDFYFKDIRDIAPENEKNRFIEEFKQKDRQRLFNLSKDILFRAALFRVHDTEYEFEWSFHHILLDGWSVGIINSEFFEIYRCYLENRQHNLPAPTPYRVFIKWLENLNKNESKTYWKRYLAGCKKSTGIPNKKSSRNSQKEYINEKISFVLGNKKTSRIKELAARNRITLNIVIQTIWGIILGKYNGTQDVVFGTVVSVRPPGMKEVESMVGLFLNTIPVRVRYEKETKFNQLLKKMQKNTVDSEPHHYYPLYEIQSETPLKQKLLNHILVFENYPLEAQLKSALTGKGQETDVKAKMKLSNIKSFEQTNYDFHIIIIPEEQMEIVLRYNANVYNRELIMKVGVQFEGTIDQVLNNENISVGMIKCLEEEKKQDILAQFNDDDLESEWRN